MFGQPPTMNISINPYKLNNPMSTNNNLTPPCLALPASDLAYRVTASGFDKPSEDDWVASQIYSYAGVYQYGYAYDDQPQEKPKDRLESACLIYIDYGGHLTLSFRGTAGNTTCGVIKDWSTNLDCDLVAMKTPQGELEVHHGFKKELDVIWKGIMHWVRHFDPEAKRKINITGHSQGGALAFIAAVKLAQEKTDEGKHYNNIQGVTTFAAPKPGGLSFAKYYNDLKLQNEVTLGSVTVRYENTADLVPLLPPNVNINYENYEWIKKIIFGLLDSEYIRNLGGPECRDYITKLVAHLEKMQVKDFLSGFYPVGDHLCFIKYNGDTKMLNREENEECITLDFSNWMMNFCYKFGIFSHSVEATPNIDWEEIINKIKEYVYPKVHQLLEAHTLQPGNGYMLAACPNEAFAKGSDGKEFMHASKSE
ncbi:lipase family [Microscilla marina ATCC 23134]|uniref:Lipase family n=2 Tax=Microscilla marina TaxID=1027 RepID=A1ZYU1_MICM2|nr:lipase family [Microscilla marina ATCC 23134]